MRLHGAGIRSYSIMVAVAILALLLAAVRVECAPGSGIAIVVSCIGYLAYKRYSEAVATRLAGGATISRSRKAGLVLSSITLAATIIGLSDFAFLAGYYGFLKVAYEAVVMSHWTPYDDPNYIGIGVVIGVPLALCVASSLRHLVWSPEATRTAFRWLKLWPVALTVCVGSLLVAEKLRERYWFCRMMADYHAGTEARADYPNRAELHDWLKRWYEQAAIRPWLPVHPDRVPKNL
jgi:hypothetical protein